MYDSKDIAQRIRERSKQLNMSTGTLLERCNLGINTISKISNGTDVLTKNFAKIADVLECSVDYLLGRTDIPEINRGIKIIDNREPSHTQIAAYSGKETKVFHTIDEEIEIMRRIEKDE